MPVAQACPTTAVRQKASTCLPRVIFPLYCIMARQWLVSEEDARREELLSSSW